MSGPSAPPPADLPEPSAPPPADLTQPSRTSSVHLPPTSRASIAEIGLPNGEIGNRDEDTDDRGIESYLADDIGPPNGDILDGEIGIRDGEIGIRATDGRLGLSADGLGLSTDGLGLHATDIVLPPDGLVLHATDPGLHADGLVPHVTDLGLHADGPVLPTDDEDTVSDEEDYLDQIEAYISGLEVSEEEVDNGIPENQDYEIPEKQDDEIPENQNEIPEARPHVSYEELFFGDEGEGGNPKVSILFSAEEDVMAMGIPVGRRVTFLRETQVNMQANHRALEAGPVQADPVQEALEAGPVQEDFSEEEDGSEEEEDGSEEEEDGSEEEGDGSEEEGDGSEEDGDGSEEDDGDSSGDSEDDQRAVQKEKGAGSRKGGGFEIGHGRLRFNFGKNFRSKRKRKNRAGPRSQSSHRCGQDGKKRMQAVRAQLAEELHLDSEATLLEILDQGDAM